MSHGPLRCRPLVGDRCRRGSTARYCPTIATPPPATSTDDDDYNKKCDAVAPSNQYYKQAAAAAAYMCM